MSKQKKKQHTNSPDAPPETKYLEFESKQHNGLCLLSWPTYVLEQTKERIKKKEKERKRTK
jgi:hypothetical protein